MQVVTAAQMREMDQQTIASGIASGAELMDRAGRGLARSVLQICSWRKLTYPRIVMLAGKGNNGGDVYAAAYHLFHRFPDIEIILVGAPDQLKGETLWHYERVREHVACTHIAEPEMWESHAWYGGVDIVVDGLLGTGSHGAPREPVAGAIRAINRARLRGALVVAVDMPSGLCADTGCANGDVVLADFTITMGLPKAGMLQSLAQPYLGCVDVIDIGLRPASDEAVAKSDTVYVGGADVRLWLPPRARMSHKGTYGKVLVIGGAPGFCGAVAMAARATCCSGAGLVHVLTPAHVAGLVAELVPEAMVHAGKCRSDGSLASDSLSAIKHLLPDIDTVLIGPGLTRHVNGSKLITAAYQLARDTIVLDADALHILADAGPTLVNGAEKHLILTPHPGEAAKLLDMIPTAVQGDRAGSVVKLAEKFQAVAVLKGAGTLVSNGKICGVNLTGTPGMATGGSGDVLAGMITALCMQVHKPWQAAAAGVFVHGLAGNMATLAKSEIGVTAWDVLERVPEAFGQILGR